MQPDSELMRVPEMAPGSMEVTTESEFFSTEFGAGSGELESHFTRSDFTRRAPPQLLKDGEILALWLLQQCLCFACCFFLGGYLGLGRPSENLDLGTRVNVLILFVFVSIALYHTSCVKAHLVHLRRGAAFHAVSWFSALGFSCFQSAFKGITISSTSEPWTWNVYLMLIVFLFFMICACWVRCRIFASPRQLLLWVYVVIFLVILYSIVPKHVSYDGLHLHHWQVGVFLMLFFAAGDSDSLVCFCLEAAGLGVFLNGIAVFGFGPMFEGMAACNKVCPTPAPTPAPT